MYVGQLCRSIARGWFFQSEGYGFSVRLEGFDLPDNEDVLIEAVRQSAQRAVLSEPSAVDVAYEPKMYDYSFARALSLDDDQWNGLLSGIIESLRPVTGQEERIACLSHKMARVIEVLDVWEDVTFTVDHAVLDKYIESVKTETVLVSPEVMHFMTVLKSGMDGALLMEFSIPLWHSFCQEERDNRKRSFAIEAARRFFKNPRHIRNVAQIEQYVILKVIGGVPPVFTYDYCDECGVEVLLPNAYTPQKCPKCSRTILPCCYCADQLLVKDAHYCTDCPLEKE